MFAALAALSTVAGGILGAISSKKKGEAAKTAAEGKALGYEAEAKAYTYKAGIAKKNQQNKLADADYARWSGETEAQTSGMKTATNISKTRAAQAGSGLEVDFGSNVATRSSMVDVGQFDQLIIRSNAARKAYGYSLEAEAYGEQATLDEMSAASATTAASYARRSGEYAEEIGTLGAVSSIVGSAGSVASKWSEGSTLGIKA